MYIQNILISKNKYYFFSPDTTQTEEFSPDFWSSSWKWLGITEKSAEIHPFV